MGKLKAVSSDVPTMSEELTALAVRSCPPGGFIEIEHTLDGVGTTRVKVSAPVQTLTVV